MLNNSCTLNLLGDIFIQIIRNPTGRSPIAGTQKPSLLLPSLPQTQVQAETPMSLLREGLLAGRSELLGR